MNPKSLTTIEWAATIVCRLRNMAQLHCSVLGAPMTWVVEHSDGLTQFALIAIPTY
jgi:hypothetical protein